MNAGGEDGGIPVKIYARGEACELEASRTDGDIAASHHNDCDDGSPTCEHGKAVMKMAKGAGAEKPGKA